MPNENISLNQIVQSLSVGMIVLDASRRVRMMNPSAEMICGWSERDALGVSIGEIFPKLEQPFPDNENPPCRIIHEISLERNGQPHFYQVHCSRLDAENAENRGWLMELHDITRVRQTEDSLRSLSRAVEQSPVTIVITDVYGNIQYANPKFSQLTGYTLEEARGQNPRILKSGEMPPDVYRDMWKAISAGKDWRGEFHNRKKNGELYWESAVISPVMDEHGQITHYLAVKEDVTEKKKMEALLHQRVQELSALQTILSDLTSELELPRLLQIIVEQLVELLGASEGEVALYDESKKEMEILVSYRQEYDFSGARIPLGQGVAGRIGLTRQAMIIEDYFSSPYHLPIFSGSRPLTLIGAPLTGGRKLYGAIVIGADYNRRTFSSEDMFLLELFCQQASVAIRNASLFGEANRLASTDGLTGLYNRRFLMRRGREEMERVRRKKAPLSMILFDIDHFKLVNDRYGHSIGDKVLKRIARVVRNDLRMFDLIGRFGGEEFLIILPEVHPEEALKIAERVRHCVEELRVGTEQGAIKATISLGVSGMTENSASLEDLIQHADLAMYRAKENGRNRVESWWL